MIGEQEEDGRKRWREREMLGNRAERDEETLCACACCVDSLG